MKTSKLDIYQHEKRFERAKTNLENTENILACNRKLILDFIDQILLNNITKARATKYIYHLTTMARNTEKSFKKFTGKDSEKLVAWINAQNYAENTKHDYKVILKKFFQWLRESNVDDHEYPEEVRWIKTTLHKKRIMPEALLTDEELKRLVEATENPRDRALILTHYESGCRIGEILSLRIENIKFDKHGAVLIVNGKTGPRRVRVVASASALANWLNNHPRRENHESPLWIGIGTAGRGKPLNYYSVRNIYRKLGKKAQVNKRVYTHLFRHTRATEMANEFTEAQMKEYFGWVQGSDMPSTYVHLSGRDVDEKILKIHGIIMEDKQVKQTFTLKECPRCRQNADSSTNFCPSCGLVLNEKTAIALEEKLRKLDDVMNQLMHDEEFKIFLEKKLSKLSDPSQPSHKSGESP